MTDPTAPSTIDLGAYRSSRLAVARATDDTGDTKFTLLVVSPKATHELAVEDYSDEASPAMKAAMKRLQQKLEEIDAAPDGAATPEFIAQVGKARAALSRIDQTLRLEKGRWQRKYAMYPQELQYFAAVQRTTRERAAILAYADRRLSGAIGADGAMRWNPFNEAGTPTYWFDEDLCVEDTLYWLWQNTPDLMRVFDGNPPALPYALDEEWLAAMTRGAADARHAAPIAA